MIRHCPACRLFKALPTLLLALLPAMLGAAAPEPPATVAELVGTWAGERSFGPRVRGPLLLRRVGGAWTADVAGRTLPMSEANGELRFEVPGDLGTFRGRLDGGSGAVLGEWIQPPVVAMFGQRFATAVRLEPAAPGLWRGEIRPLEDRVRIYLVIQPTELGGGRAFLRNPEVNFGRLFELTEVTLEGDRVELRGHHFLRPDEHRTYFQGVYSGEHRQLTLFIESFGGHFDLAPLAPGEASDFYPRARSRAPYRYLEPPRLDDGWETADPASVGMAVGPLEALVRQIASTPIAAVDSPAIDALLVARHGKLVLEEYFHGHHRDAPHDVRSASKSLTTTLAGAAIAATDRVALTTPVYATMSGGAPAADLDPRARRMTLEHLLTMTSGFACDDWDGASPGGEDRMQSQTAQPDWYRYILDQPMLHEPGDHGAYCSGGMNLAGGVVARALGRPLTDLFDELLARPLALGPYHTNLMPTGEAYAGGGLRITARDFLKFGQLMLDDGRWRGREILPPGWVRDALTPRHELNGEGYGFGWWLFDYELDGHRWRAFYAGGNGGNYIIGVPDLDLAIVFQASNYGQRVQHRTKYDDVPEFVLRAVLAESAAAPRPGS